MLPKTPEYNCPSDGNPLDVVDAEDSQPYYFCSVCRQMYHQVHLKDLKAEQTWRESAAKRGLTSAFLEFDFVSALRQPSCTGRLIDPQVGHVEGSPVHGGDPTQ